MKNNILNLFGVMAVLWTSMSPLWGQGSVSGVLNDDAGRPYGDGARIMVIRVAEKPEGFEPFSSNVVTLKDGSYRVPNVPAGKYDLCIWISGGDYVNVCRWGKAAGSATVADGENTVSNLSLTRGRIFTIDVKDDEGYLTRHENKSLGGFLDVGVLNGYRDFVSADIATLDGNARKYRIVVPADTKFKVMVQSSLFNVTTLDEASQSLNVLKDLDQTIAAKEVTKGVTVKVIGVKAIDMAK